MSYIVGLDLGQSTDYTALCALRRGERKGPDGKTPETVYDCNHLQRWPLGSSYVRIVEDVGELMARPELSGGVLVVDASGVGRPVIDLLRRAQLPAELVPVVITAGVSESKQDYYHVSKIILVTAGQLLLQQRRLRIAKALKETRLLVRELENYRYKLTAAANETFNAREGAHDDLVLAAALACWWGEKFPPWGPGAFACSPPEESLTGHLLRAGEDLTRPRDMYAPDLDDDRGRDRWYSEV